MALLGSPHSAAFSLEDRRQAVLDAYAHSSRLSIDVRAFLGSRGSAVLGLRPPRIA
jgi:hypothetical protein